MEESTRLDVTPKASPAKDRRAAFATSRSLHKTEVGEDHASEENVACPVAKESFSNGWTEKPGSLASHSVQKWLTDCVSTEDKNGATAQKGANRVKPGSNIEDDLLLGAEAQNLCRSKTVPGILNRSREGIINLPKANKKKVGFHNMGQSFNSSSSGNTLSSVCELLDLCEENPEEILYNLGFGHDEPDIASKIPPRFFSAPSQANGIDFRVFLQCQLLRMDRENPTLANRFRQVEVFATVADAFSSLYSRVSGISVDMIMRDAASSLTSVPETQEATGGVTVKAATRLLNTVRTRRSLSSPVDIEQKQREHPFKACVLADSASPAADKKPPSPTSLGSTASAATATREDEQSENSPAGRIRQLREDNLQRLSTRLSERLCLDPLTEEVFLPASEEDEPVFMPDDTSLTQPDVQQTSALEVEPLCRHSSPCEAVTTQSSNYTSDLEQDDVTITVADATLASDQSPLAGGAVCSETEADPKAQLYGVPCPEQKEWLRKPLTSTPDTAGEPSPRRPLLAEAIQKESFDIEEIQSNEDEGAVNIANSLHHTFPKCKRGLYAGEMLLRANSGQSDSSGFEDINTDCIAMSSIQTHITSLGKMGSSAESFDSQTTLTLPSETQPCDDVADISICKKTSVSPIYNRSFGDSKNNIQGERTIDDKSVADEVKMLLEVKKCQHDQCSSDLAATDTVAIQCPLVNVELNTNTSPASAPCKAFDCKAQELNCMSVHSPFLLQPTSKRDFSGSKENESGVLKHVQHEKSEDVIYNESLKPMHHCVGLEVQGSASSEKDVAGHNSLKDALGSEMASDKDNSRANPEKESVCFSLPMSDLKIASEECATPIALEKYVTLQSDAEGHDVGDTKLCQNDSAAKYSFLVKSDENGDAQENDIYPINENIESALQRLSFRKSMKQPMRSPQGSIGPFGVHELVTTAFPESIGSHEADETFSLVQEHRTCLSPTKVVSSINIQMAPDRKMSCSPVAFTFKYNTTEEDKLKDPVGRRKPKLIKQMSAPVLEMTPSKEDLQQQQTMSQAPDSFQDTATMSCRSVLFVPQQKQPIDHASLYRTVSLDAGLGCNMSPLQRAQSCQGCCFQCHHRPMPCYHAVHTQSYCTRVQCSSVHGHTSQCDDYHSHSTTPGVTSPLCHFPMPPSFSRPDVEADLHRILFDIRTSTNKLSTFNVQNMHMLVDLHTLKQNVRHFHIELTELEISILSRQASIRRPLREQERLEGEHLRGLRWTVRKELMELEGHLEERTHELELHQETSNFRSSIQCSEAPSPSFSRTLSDELSPSFIDDEVELVNEVHLGQLGSCVSAFPSAEAECEEGATAAPEIDVKKEFSGAKEIAKVLHEIKESVVGEIRRELVEKLLPIFNFSTKPVHKNTDEKE